MVVNYSQRAQHSLRAALSGLVLTLAIGASLLLGFADPAQAQEPLPLEETRLEQLRSQLDTLGPSDTLLDAWMIVERYATPAWTYSFVQSRQESVSSTSQRLERLQGDLASLSLEARLAGHDTLSHGLAEWRRALANLPEHRVPGRLTPTWLMNHLRHVPSIQDLASLGWCQPPSWVELWSANGVTRQTWQPGMTTRSLLHSVPTDAYQNADFAHVVTPLGRTQRIGIAAWNHQTLPLVPGSRVMISLPLASTTARWMNTALPQFLTTRLPGDQCVKLPLSSSVVTPHVH